MTKTSIITIGDELLIGQVIDTNSAWMAQELNRAGIWVNRRLAIGDGRIDILKALNAESDTSDIILITGGLGPTADDITKPILCEYFNTTLIINKEALENVKNIFVNILKRPMSDRILKQAEVPASCQVIQNKRGTAPGMLFEKNGKIFVSMPGVPHEMKGMMKDTVIPYLQNRFATNFISRRWQIIFRILNWPCQRKSNWLTYQIMAWCVYALRQMQTRQANWNYNLTNCSPI
jgi:nicotinamide-nucleotide amidase